MLGELENGLCLLLVHDDELVIRDVSSVSNVGDLSVEAGFSNTQDQEMMQAYCDGVPDKATFGRMVIYKAMCDLLWTLWGLIQHADSNPAENFWAYATGRFERCKNLMNHPDFNAHIKAITKF